jgi:hypothetical protein
LNKIESTKISVAFECLGLLQAVKKCVLLERIWMRFEISFQLLTKCYWDFGTRLEAVTHKKMFERVFHWKENDREYDGLSSVWRVKRGTEMTRELWKQQRKGSNKEQEAKKENKTKTKRKKENQTKTKRTKWTNGERVKADKDGRQKSRRCCLTITSSPDSSHLAHSMSLAASTFFPHNP